MTAAAALPEDPTSPTIVSSPDGRSFRLRTAAEEGLRPGDYVTIADGAGAEHLGYVESVDEVTETTTWAAGSILPGPVDPRPVPVGFGSAQRSRVPSATSSRPPEPPCPSAPWSATRRSRSG